MTLWAPEGHDLHVKVVAFQPLTGDQLAYGPSCWTMGITLSEAAGVQSQIIIFDGDSINGDRSDTINLAPNATVRQNPGGAGTPYDSGLFLHLAQGTAVNVSLTIGRWVKRQ